MRVFKSVWQHYTPTPSILWLLEQFRKMLNDCIRIGLAENVTSLKSLSLKAYKQLSRYDVASYYLRKKYGLLKYDCRVDSQHGGT